MSTSDLATNTPSSCVGISQGKRYFHVAAWQGLAWQQQKGKHFDKGSLACATANVYAWNHCVCLKRWQQEQKTLTLIGLVLTKVRQSAWTPVSLAFTQKKICSCARRDQSLGCLPFRNTTFLLNHVIHTTDLYFNTISRHNAFLSEFQVIKTLCMDRPQCTHKGADAVQARKHNEFQTLEKYSLVTHKTCIEVERLQGLLVSGLWVTALLECSLSRRAREVLHWKRTWFPAKCF